MAISDKQSLTGMDKTQSAPLFGFVPLGSRQPSFLLPVFGNHNYLLIQDADNKNRISGFLPGYLTPKTVVIPNTERFACKVGDPKLFAFQLPDGKILMGSETNIAKALETHLADLELYPYIRPGVLKFLAEFGRAGSVRKELQFKIEGLEREFAKMARRRSWSEVGHIKQAPKSPQHGKMTHAHVIAEMAQRTGTSKKVVEDLMKNLVDLAYREAKRGEFAIPGLGKLVTQNRKARMGRNPATGEEIKIPPKTVLKFRVAKAAKDAVLGNKKMQYRKQRNSKIP